MAYLELPYSRNLKDCYYMLLSHHPDWFVSDFSELKIFIHILQRTLNFGREEFSTSLLKSNDFKKGLITSTTTTTSLVLYRVLKRFEKRGLILKLSEKRPTRYIINLPALIYTTLKVYESSGNKHHSHAKYQKVAGDSLAYNASIDNPVNPKLNINEEVYMEFEEAINNAHDTTKKAKDKKLEKIKKKEDPRVADMFYLFTETCRLLDVKGYFPKKRTGKIAGNVLYFIEECKENGVKWSDVVEDICKYWRKFRIGVLTTEKGSEIILNSSVNFPDFFVNRHKILMTINSRRSVWDAEASQVVQINHVDLYATDTQPYKH